MQIWTIETLKLPLKFNWKISRNTSEFKENFIITIQENNFSGQGEVAFNIRYGETKEKILDEFACFSKLYNKQKLFGDQDVKWLQENNSLSSSLKMGIHQAYINLLLKRENKTLSDILKIKIPINLTTSFSIPIIAEQEISEFISKNKLSDYPFIKLKINGFKSVSLVNKLLASYNGKIRIDANEGFLNYKEVLNFINQLSDLNNIEFIEQPLPSSLDKEMIFLKGKCNVDFIADESITFNQELKELSKYFDGVNIKLMKSGTLTTAITQIQTAKKLGLKVMLGCMIETSLGISFAYALGNDVDYIDLDGFLLIKEDPFLLLKEEKGIISLRV